MFVALVEVLFFIRLLSFFYEISLFFMHERWSSQELCDVWICTLMSFYRFSLHLNGLDTRITGACKIIRITFDNIKALKFNRKFFNVMSTVVPLNIFQTHHNTWLILKFMINQTFRAFKCNFQSHWFNYPTILFKIYSVQSFEETATFIKYAM